jgi:hypothetical protein
MPPASIVPLAEARLIESCDSHKRTTRLDRGETWPCQVKLRLTKMMAVQVAVGKMSPQEMGALPSLDDEDLRLFGVVMQHFCSST